MHTHIRRGLAIAGAAFAILVGTVVVPAMGTSTPPAPPATPASAVRLHLGTDGDYFAYGTAKQPLTTSSGSCAITSAQPLIALSAGGTDKPGLAGDSIGVKSGAKTYSKTTSTSGSNGTPCGQISSSQKLTLRPGTALSGRSFSKVRLDLEMTGNGYVLLTFLRTSNGQTATYKLQTGKSIDAAQKAEADYDKVAPYTVSSGPGDEIDACAAPNSSGPNSGGNDNCQWTVAPGFDFDTISLSAKVGTVALEGGSDFGNSTSYESLFYLSNTAPDAVGDTVTTAEDTAATGNLLANDTDSEGDALTVTSSTSPAHGQASVSANGAFTYTPDHDYNGPDSFTYTASDGKATDSATVTITVSPVNDPPVAKSGSSSTPEDTPATITVATDVDSTSLTASCTSTSGGTYDDNGDGTITYHPPTNYVGTDTVECSVADDQGGTSETVATVAVGILPVNDAPVAVDDEAEADEASTVEIDVLANDSDVDEDTLSVTNVSNPANGTAVSTGGAVNYTPDPGFTGEDTFTYTADDGSSPSNTATVTVTVFPTLCTGETVTDIDGDVSGSFTRLSDGFECKRYALDAVDADGTVLFTPQGDSEVVYRGFLQFAPTAAPTLGSGGAFSLLLEYDPTGGTTYQPVLWCINPQFDGDDLVTSATLPVGQSWCIANADLRGNADGDIATVWQVYGVDDPRYK